MVGESGPQLNNASSPALGNRPVLFFSRILFHRVGVKTFFSNSISHSIGRKRKSRHLKWFLSRLCNCNRQIRTPCEKGSIVSRSTRPSRLKSNVGKRCLCADKSVWFCGGVRRFHPEEQHAQLRVQVSFSRGHNHGAPNSFRNAILGLMTELNAAVTFQIFRAVCLVFDFSLQLLSRQVSNPSILFGWCFVLRFPRLCCAWFRTKYEGCPRIYRRRSTSRQQS